MSTWLISVTRGLTGNRDVGSIADGMAPSTPTAALRLCLQQRGTQTGLPDGPARLPATITTNSPEAHHLQRVADKVFLGWTGLAAKSLRLGAAAGGEIATLHRSV